MVLRSFEFSPTAPPYDHDHEYDPANTSTITSTNTILTACLIVAAYLSGSLPAGVWVGRRAGVDVRRSGSGNIGATNVARTVGARAALLTLGGDIGKGLIPVLVARALGLSPWA